MLSQHPLISRLACVAVLCGSLSTGAFAQGLAVTTVRQFSTPSPRAGVIQAANGNFYGVTTGGGANNQGVIYSYSATAGVYSELRAFSGGDGAYPQAELVQGADNVLYGVASGGGTTNQGTIFRVTTGGAFTLLHSFTGPDGARPLAALTVGAGGVLYGATSQGGARDKGLVFSLGVDGTFTVLHEFGSIGNDGVTPRGPLLIGTDGSLLGTTYAGGQAGSGTVFQITAAGAYAQLYAFGNSLANPLGNLVQTPDGTLYGVASTGSFGFNGIAGGVYSLAADGTITVLHAFSYNDGQTPLAGLVLARDGNLYGTTSVGGANYSSYGVVYQITVGGAYTIFHTFSQSVLEGGLSQAPLVQGADDFLYGVTAGNTYLGGTLFKIRDDGALTTLHTFTSPNGANPQPGLLHASDGNIYGALYNGNSGYGSIFQLTAADVFSTFHTFSGSTEDGASPAGNLFQGADNNIYGLTNSGGASIYSNGFFYQLTLTGTLTKIYDFGNNGTSGFRGGVIQAGDGSFYGASVYGIQPTGSAGTLFNLTLAGGNTLIHSFDNANGYYYGPNADGAFPDSPLLQLPNGVIYGVASNGGSFGDGVAFTISSGGSFSVLRNFAATAANPTGGLIVGGDGNLYGTSASGATDGLGAYGSVFRLTPAGAVTNVHYFTPEEGLYPQSLILGSDGKYYGVASDGGAYNGGSVFQMTPAGAVTNLHSFRLFEEGRSPIGRLVETAPDVFYGVASAGGATDSGSLFKFTVNPHGSISYSAPGYLVSEGGGNVTVRVGRVGGALGNVTATFATMDGTAVAGVDYQPISGTVSWADGDSAVKSFSVPIVNRAITDGSARTFGLSLSFPTGGANFGDAPSASVSILEVAASPTPTPTPSPTATPTQTPTPTPTVTPPITPPPPGVSPTPTPTPAPSPTPTSTPAPTPTPLPVQPTVSLTQPIDGTVFTAGGLLPLTASLDDPAGAAVTVRFYIGSALVAELRPPAALFYNGVAPAAGSYKVVAIATDAAGRQSVSSRTISVTDVGANAPGGSGAIVPDLTDRVFAAGATVPIAATFDTAADITQVTFLADGTPFAVLDGAGNPVPSVAGNPRPVRQEGGATPAGKVYQTSFQLPGSNRLVNILAQALTSLGTTVSSQAISVRAAVTGDQAPKVAIGAFANGPRVRVGQTVSTSVQVSDPDAANPSAARPRGPSTRDEFAPSGLIARVEYFVNALRVKDAPQRPYGFDFSPPSAGTYVLSAIATDGSGLATVSAPARVEAFVAPGVSVAVKGASQVSEAGGKVKFLVSRDGTDLSADLVVNYKVKGSARSGVDYQATSGSITIPSGAASAKLKIKAIDNATSDGARSLTVKLLPEPSGAYDILKAGKKANASILDND